MQLDTMSQHTQLTPAEADEILHLVSQSVIPVPGGSSNSSQIVMSSLLYAA
jgi:hypothetical protein